jgi:hypothetical protein
MFFLYDALLTFLTSSMCTLAGGPFQAFPFKKIKDAFSCLALLVNRCPVTCRKTRSLVSQPVEGKRPLASAGGLLFYISL